MKMKFNIIWNLSVLEFPLKYFILIWLWKIDMEKWYSEHTLYLLVDFPQVMAQLGKYAFYGDRWEVSHQNQKQQDKKK